MFLNNSFYISMVKMAFQVIRKLDYSVYSRDTTDWLVIWKNKLDLYFKVTPKPRPSGSKFKCRKNSKSTGKHISFLNVFLGGGRTLEILSLKKQENIMKFIKEINKLHKRKL